MAEWRIKNVSSNTAEIAKALNVSEVTARLIVNRGIKSYEEANQFLNPDLSNLPPSAEITGVTEAAVRLLEHIENGAKIAVYGDYDVDGVMSAVILQKCLKALGADFIYYVPDRENEGYGLSAASVQKLRNLGVSLIIACDNGISALNEADLIYENGMELIVIDHHEPVCDTNGKELLPRAEVIVNPKIKNCRYPFKMMCAAGLCYRFALHLFETTKTPPPDPDELLVFAALATVCDIVDLLGDNRIIVRNGLLKVINTNNKGLRALLNAYELKNLTTFHFGFVLGPTINAAGRLETAEIATRLFLTDDETEASKIAEKLYELNKSRRAITEEAYNRLLTVLSDTIQNEQKVYVLYDDKIHESVAGIIAGRIKERFNHPTIVITKGKDCAKGSARSIEGYNIYNALQEASGLFIKFGGHAQAAGFSIPYEKIDDLRQILNERCTLETFIPRIHIDMRLPIKEATLGLSDALLQLAPFGKANKEPLFAEKSVVFNKISFIGKEMNIVKLWPRDNPAVTAISFDGCEKFLEIAREKAGTDDKLLLSTLSSFEMDIVYTVAKNEYRGEGGIQLILKDFR